MPLLSVENVCKSYHSRDVLDDVSFKINSGDRIAFIGNNGAGKSTLFKIIKGMVEPEGGKVIFHNGAIAGFLSQNMDEQELSSYTLKPQKLLDIEAEIKELEYEISSSKLNPEQSEYKTLMDNYSKKTSEYEAAGGYDYEYRIKDALAGLNVDKSVWDRDDFANLSGGEKMRVCLAQLIVAHPDILLLDEPTNHLDVDAIEWLEKFLISYSGSVFVISHDRFFMDRIANRIIELTDGKIKEYVGNYSEFVNQKEAFCKSQQALVKNLQNELEHQLDVKQTMLSHRNISGYHQREKMVKKLQDILINEQSKLSGGSDQMNFKMVPKEMTGDQDRLILSVNDIGKAFDDKVLFEHISFELKAQEKYFLCGPNGCGKTTLLNMLLGKEAGFTGKVFISGTVECGYMGQFVPFDDENKTAFDELMSRSNLSETDARSMLARFGFRDIDVFKKINVLSGGERSRLYLCCLLMEKPDVLFLDEPTNHLDINSREVLEDALCAYEGAIVCVSHDRFFIEKCADKIIGFMDGGTSLFDAYKDYRKQYQAFKDKALNKSLSSDFSKRSTTTVSKDNSNRLTEGKIVSQNKAKERKETAKKRERYRELDKLISEYEQKQKEYEEKFISGAEPKDYEDYAKLMEELNAFYDEYLELSELFDG